MFSMSLINMFRLSLLQGIFLTLGLNSGLLDCRWVLYQLSHKGSPRILEWEAYPFSRGSSWPRNRTRVGCFERTASKHVYYQGWNRSPAQVGCMRQVLRAGALGKPRGMGWGGRWEGGSGWGLHVNPWLIHVNVWQNPLQYCRVISL